METQATTPAAIRLACDGEAVMRIGAICLFFQDYLGLTLSEGNVCRIAVRIFLEAIRRNDEGKKVVILRDAYSDEGGISFSPGTYRATLRSEGGSGSSDLRRMIDPDFSPAELRAIDKEVRGGCFMDRATFLTHAIGFLNTVCTHRILYGRRSFWGYVYHAPVERRSWWPWAKPKIMHEERTEGLRLDEFLQQLAR